MCEIEFTTDDEWSEQVSAELEVSNSSRLERKVMATLELVSDIEGRTYEVSLNVHYNEDNNLTSMIVKPAEGTGWMVEGENTTGRLHCILGPRGGATRLEYEDDFCNYSIDYSNKSGMWRRFFNRVERLDAPKDDEDTDADADDDGQELAADGREPEDDDNDVPDDVDHPVYDRDDDPRFDTGDVVEFEYDGEDTIAVVKYQTGRSGSSDNEHTYSVQLPSDTNASGWTTVSDSRTEKIGEFDNDADPKFWMCASVDSWIDENIDDGDDTPGVLIDHENSEEFLRALRYGDRVEFDGDEWKVIDEASESFAGVEFRSLTGYHPGTTTLKPSSGYGGSVVVQHTMGMGAHYNRLEILERSEDTDGQELVTDGGHDLEGPNDAGSWECDECGKETETTAYETAKGVWWLQCTECGSLKHLDDDHDDTEFEAGDLSVGDKFDGPEDSRLEITDEHDGVLIIDEYDNHGEPVVNQSIRASGLAFKLNREGYERVGDDTELVTDGGQVHVSSIEFDRMLDLASDHVDETVTLEYHSSFAGGPTEYEGTITDTGDDKVYVHVESGETRIISHGEVRAPSDQADSGEMRIGQNASLTFHSEDDDTELVTDGGRATHPDYRSGAKLSGEITDAFGSLETHSASGDEFVVSYEGFMGDKITSMAAKHGFRVAYVGTALVEFERIDGHHTDPRNASDE